MDLFELLTTLYTEQIIVLFDSVLKNLPIGKILLAKFTKLYVTYFSEMEQCITKWNKLIRKRTVN